MTRQTAIAIMVFFLGGCAHELDAEERLTRTIESRVALPEGSSALAHYRRYYAWAKDDQSLVEAVYVRGGRPDRLWLSRQEMPVVLDGGCEVITFSFDVEAGTAEAIRCN